MDGAIGVLVRYGYLVVFGSVLAEQIGLPIPAVPFLLAAGGLATIPPPLAGIARMPIREFLVFSGLGGVLWAGAFVAVGWVFSHQLELAAEYALRFGSWSLTVLAAAIAGYIAWKYIGRQRFLRQIRIARITPEELKRRLDEGVDMLVVDVRDRLDFEAEPSIIPGALHMTLEELEDRHHEIPRAREIVLYCT